MFKKDMAPLGRRTQRVVNKGKGARSAAMPDRAQINSLGRPGASSVNDYAKATPMAQGVPSGNVGGPSGGPWPLT